MEKIPTAEEFAKKHHPMKTYPADWNVMKEFAKLHVEQALKEASEKGKCSNGTSVVLKNSILNSYSLDNIK